MESGSDVAGNTEDSALPKRRVRLYAILATVVALWVSAWIVAYTFIYPSIISSTYYIAGYEFGFVRRGLAGEFTSFLSSIPFFGDGNIIDAALRQRWFVLVVNLAAFGSIIDFLLSLKPKSEHRIWLALVVLMLPGWLQIMTALGSPDALGAALLAWYVIALAKITSNRSALLASGVQGLAITVLVFAHEATAMAYALGTVLAIVVFRTRRKKSMKFVHIPLAVLPGLVATACVAAFGNVDNGFVSKVCASIPHRVVHIDLLGRDVEYRQFAYMYALRFYGESVGEAAKNVGDIGVLALALSTILGLLIFTLTIRCISFVAGVRFSEFLQKFVIGKRNAANALLMAAAAMLWIPVFVVAYDWMRFWCVITINVGLVYIVYAAETIDAQVRPSPKSRRRFFIIFAILCILPPVPSSIPHLPLQTQSFDKAFAELTSGAPASCRR